MLIRNKKRLYLFVSVDCTQTLLYFHISLFYFKIDVSFSCVCPVIDHEFRHNTVEVAVDPRGDYYNNKGRRVKLK